MALFWMSFVETDGPGEDEFLGVIITHADNFFDALANTIGKGINPGGEIVAHEIDDHPLLFDKKDRLLQADELTPVVAAIEQATKPN